jgi:hypothetical protein
VFRNRRARVLPLCVAILLLNGAVACYGAVAESSATPVVQEIKTESGDSAVRYPQLSGLTDTAVQEAINSGIVEDAKIAQRMVTLATLPKGGTGLQVRYDAFLKENVFSAIIDAVGILENGRAGQTYTAFHYLLSTGESFPVTLLFADPEGAVSAMENILLSTYLDELGSYVENASLTPLPTDDFSLNEDGITFYYPRDQFSLVSGYCGAAQFYYSELLPYLDQNADGLPTQLGLLPAQMTDAQMKAAIQYSAKEGKLPHIPVKLGDPMPEVIDAYRLLREPDQYPGGRYCQMEAPLFRQTLVLTDALTGGFDNSVVTGLMSFRADLYGLRAGETTRERWRQVLGQPDDSIDFDESLAASYGLPVGTADYYNYDHSQLLLYADTDGVLQAVRLTRS